MTLKDKENLLVGVIMGSFLPSAKKTELIELVRTEATKESKPQTNADRIRAMSDEELANFVASKIVNIENHKMLEQGHTPTATQLSALGATMHDILIMWLKQPAEEEKTVTEGHR